MTKFEAYQAVINGQVNEDVVEKFREMLETHEAEAEKRRNRAAEKRAEKLAAEKVLEDGIMEVLGEEPMTASDIAEAVEGINTPQKATVVVKRLVAAGLATVQDVKGKKGKVKGYTLAQALTGQNYVYVLLIRYTYTKNGSFQTRFFISTYVYIYVYVLLIRYF